MLANVSKHKFYFFIFGIDTNRFNRYPGKTWKIKKKSFLQNKVLKKIMHEKKSP